MLSSVFPVLPFSNKKKTQLRETPRGPSKILQGVCEILSEPIVLSERN